MLGEVGPRGKIKLNFVLLSRASTIISVKGRFLCKQPLRERKQLADGISAVIWPIFQTKSSNVAVEKNKCTYSNKVEKKSFIKESAYMGRVPTNHVAILSFGLCYMCS